MEPTMIKPEPIADYACNTGEGPIYHPDENAVFWVDIPAGRLFRYDLASDKHREVLRTEPIGGTTIQADGSLLLFMARGQVVIWREGSPLEVVIPEIPAEAGSRFNDVIADPAGRVFCGTMSSDAGPGRLYRLDPDGTYRVVLEGIGGSNGMGFSPDRRTMYYIDTPKLEVYAFDFDQPSGEISNQRVLIRTTGEGYPDGMTVDADGNLWVAFWNGARLVQYSPEGEELRTIPFEGVRKVSSVTFGGDAYATAFATTAGGHQKETDGPLAGALYKLDLGVRGVPEFRSRIQLKP